MKPISLSKSYTTMIDHKTRILHIGHGIKWICVSRIIQWCFCETQYVSCAVWPVMRAQSVHNPCETPALARDNVLHSHVMHTCTLGWVGATAVVWCSEGIHELCGALKCSRAMVRCFMGRNAMMRSFYEEVSCKDMVGTGLSQVYLPKKNKNK